LPDYADAFEVTRTPTDQRSAEQWARDGFEGLPVTMRRPLLLIHRWILGFRLGPWASPEHVLGWRIVTSEPELLHLEARSPLLSGHMVWRLHPERSTDTPGIGEEMLRHTDSSARRALRYIGATVLVVDPFDQDTAEMWRERFGFQDSEQPVPGNRHLRRQWLSLQQ
jgi:hypothetical protein